MRKSAMVAALILASGAPAQADTGRDKTPVTVEVIGSGAVEIHASTERLSLSYGGRGASLAAAQAAKAKKEAEVLRLLAAEGVPASAITPLSAADLAKLSMLGSLTAIGGGTDAAEETGEKADDGRTVEVGTLAQAQALAAKLKAIGVQVGDPTPSYDNVVGARRDARLAALADARKGAERYATALGMKLGSVRRINETGGGFMLPGLQEKFSEMLATGGGGLLRQMMQPPQETLKVEESIVVEFGLVP